MASIDGSDKSWEYFGKHDPYYGVITSSEFQQANLNQEAKARFFESGQHHIDRVLNIIQTHLIPGFIPTKALDFGCGVGRLTIPLASVCTSVIAVDVSESMLKEAKANCDQRGLANVQFVTSEQALAECSDPIDFLHSFIVFQHIPPQRGEAIVRQLLDRLQVGGVGVLHFTYLRKASLRERIVYWATNSVPLLNGVINLVYRKKPFAYPTIQMHAYSLQTVFHILQEKNCHQVYVQFSDHSNPRTTDYGVMVFFQKQPLPSW